MMQSFMAQPPAGAPGPSMTGLPAGAAPNLNATLAAQQPGLAAGQNQLQQGLAAGALQGMQIPGGGAPPIGGPGLPFAKGGKVDPEGETLAKKRRPDRQWGDTSQDAENLPPVPMKKAKGGAALTRKPKAPAVSIAIVNKKRPVPTPSPYDMEDDASQPPVMAGGGQWIQGAIKKPGALHKQLGVPQGEKIPAKKLAAAAGKGGKLGQRARLAQTLKGMHKNKGGKCDKMAAGGAAKQRKGFPNTQAPTKPKAFAAGGKVRGCGVATKGCGFSGIF
jgi:hypothetical protein